MATTQSILKDIDLRYRNSFLTEQKLVWLNEEQRELFEILELDSPPYTFTTVAGENYYPFPDQFDTTQIKTVTFQINDANFPAYVELPFLRNDDKQYVIDRPWYSIVSNAFYLHVPDVVPDNRHVYIYTDSDPTEVTSDNLNVEPDLPTKYQEILKLGILKRICQARKDIPMQNNYDISYQEKITDVLWERKLKEPEFIQPADYNYKPTWRTSYGGWPFVGRG